MDDIILIAVSIAAFLLLLKVTPYILEAVIFLAKSVYWFFVGWFAMLDTIRTVRAARRRYRLHAANNPAPAVDVQEEMTDEDKIELKRKIITDAMRAELDEAQRELDEKNIEEKAYKTRCNGIRAKYEKFFNNLGDAQ